jgi:hypothetical protein
MNRTPPDFFDDALRRMEPQSPADKPPQDDLPDGFLFSGNRHEGVPREISLL